MGLIRLPIFGLISVFFFEAQLELTSVLLLGKKMFKISKIDFSPLKSLKMGCGRHPEFGKFCIQAEISRA